MGKMGKENKQGKKMWPLMLGIVLFLIGVVTTLFLLNKKSGPELQSSDMQLAEDGNNKIEIQDEIVEILPLALRTPLPSDAAPIEGIEDFITLSKAANGINDTTKVFMFPSVCVSNYALGKSSLKTKDEQLITAFAELFKKTNRQAKIMVEGFGCNLGTDIANDKVSLARANIVKDQLVKAGLKNEEVEVIGYGKKRNHEFNYSRPEEYRRVIVKIK